jgi:tetratricopeptide (TPR) repeat protein
LAKPATLAWLAVIVFLTLLYAFELLQRALVLLRDGSAVAIVMGLAILVLPPFAVAFVLIEIRFGLRAANLQRQVDQAGIAFDYELRPSGKAKKESAEVGFERFKALVEENEENHLYWFLLADAYDKMGDRARARKAARKAFLLAKQAGAL